MMRAVDRCLDQMFTEMAKCRCRLVTTVLQIVEWGKAGLFCFPYEDIPVLTATNDLPTIIANLEDDR